MTVGAAIQHLLAERGTGAPTYVIGSPAIFRHVADAGQRIVNGTERRGRSRDRRRRRSRRVRLRGAARRDPGGDRRRRDDRRRPRSHLSRRRRDRRPATGAIVAALEYATERTAEVGRQARAADLLHRARPPRPRQDAGRRRPSRLRPGGRVRGRARRARSCSPASPPAQQAEAATDPAPVAIAEDLNALRWRREAVADRQSLGRRRPDGAGPARRSSRP